jgi:predicted ATPase/class 3 adenylate cyclase
VPVFLFTDIEGSTTRWETRPREMLDALARHDGILRTAIQEHHGRIFKTVGDAFCAVFEDPGDAVAAAVAAQTRLGASDWQNIEGLHVRMALHAGDAAERDGDFFGPPVNRVARLLSTAHGGQIVVSGTLADAVQPALTNGVQLVALGTFRLKDLERPERIFQLSAPGLPGKFKPLITLDAIPNNLPVQSTAFVGRSQDIAQIRSLLRENRLLTIAGPGGVGKTRAALQCAADRMDRMTDGVWFVNLAPLTDPSLVASTINTVVGAGEGNDAEALDSLVEYLKSRTMLIVVDNCEHVVEEAARCIAAIHERCSHVTIVATSREALHIDGEQVYRLRPLEPEDSMSLFVTRAQSVSPRFRLTAENRPHVEAICAHLDGIPLAIELAAARAHALSPQQLAERLHQRFRLLTAGGRTTLPRQQTLQALIDWSHDLLTDIEKILFRRLAVFRGSFTLESASAVCADDTLDEWTIVDLLTSLADKSLVVADMQTERPRYHLLESIREYAWSKLQTEGSASARYHLLESIREYASTKLHEAGEGAQLQLCHAQFFALQAVQAYRQFDTSPPPNWLAGLAPDLDNFRAAMEFSLGGETARLGVQLTADIAPMFLRLSLLHEGIEWCERARALAGGAPTATRARLHYVLSMLFNNRGDYASALPHALAAVELSREAGDERGLVRALSQTAQQLASLERFDEAKPFLRESLQSAEQLIDPRLFAATLRRCAFALPPSEIDEARAQFQKAVSVLQTSGDFAEACLVFQWWAEAEASAGNFERALNIAAEGLHCADDDDRMYLCSNMAGYAIAARNFAGAAPLACEALERAVHARHEVAISIALLYSSAALLESAPEDAARVFGFARRRMEALAWSGFHADRTARENIYSELQRRFDAVDLERLFVEGARWDEGQALSRTPSICAGPSSGGQRSSPYQRTAG